MKAGELRHFSHFPLPGDLGGGPNPACHVRSSRRPLDVGGTVFNIICLDLRKRAVDISRVNLYSPGAFYTTQAYRTGSLRQHREDLFLDENISHWLRASDVQHFELV